MKGEKYRREANWTAFYAQLGIIGPKLLTNVPDGLVSFIEMEARSTDSYWSSELEEVLLSGWAEDPATAVWKAVQEWAANVHEHADTVLGRYFSIPWQSNVDSVERRIEALYNKELIDELILAANEPEVVSGWGSFPHLMLQVVVEPQQKNAEGVLIRAIEIPWRKIITHLEKDWSLAFQISSRQWEEMIAAAFDQANYDEVILTPRSGDHGRDVIAVKHGVGSMRIINSVKAYKPGKLVRYDDVRALAGVLLGDSKASKGIITTTSDFPPNIANDPYISSLMPYRLELMNGVKLKRWLEDLSKNRYP